MRRWLPALTGSGLREGCGDGDAQANGFGRANAGRCRRAGTHGALRRGGVGPPPGRRARAAGQDPRPARRRRERWPPGWAACRAGRRTGFPDRGAGPAGNSRARDAAAATARSRRAGVRGPDGPHRPGHGGGASAVGRCRTDSGFRASCQAGDRIGFRHEIRSGRSALGRAVARRVFPGSGAASRAVSARTGGRGARPVAIDPGPCVRGGGGDRIGRHGLSGAWPPRRSGNPGRGPDRHGDDRNGGRRAAACHGATPDRPTAMCAGSGARCPAAAGGRRDPGTAAPATGP